MTQELVLALRNEVTLEDAPDDQVALAAPWTRLTLDNPTPGLIAAMEMLAAGGASEDALADRVLEADGSGGLALLYYYLQRCLRARFLRYAVVAAGQPLVSVVPMVPGFTLAAPRIDPDEPFQLSRFAYLRREGSDLLLESPLSTARTILAGPTAAALVSMLARPRTAHELSTDADGLTPEATAALLRLLVSAGVVGAAGTLAEDADPTLAQWEFHDLLFHARSRRGRHDYPFGGTFRFLDRLPPPPALKPRMSDAVVPLYRPDLDRLAVEDPSLTRVMEARESVRRFGDPPINVRQLGEFLFRVGRVRQIVEADPARGIRYATSSRPYPSGGATYDLELYVTVNACVDLAPGFYHYDPGEHQLCQLADRNAQVEALLRDAQGAAALTDELQVLLTLASRFQRLSWKYEGMAYATTLKNVGVLYQTMYLVATAMGLAPCALGGGDADLFAAAAGTDYYAESSVGEFLLGSVPPATP